MGPRWLLVFVLGGCSMSPATMQMKALPQGAGDEVNGALKDAVAAEVASLVDVYKWFHQNAELSNREVKTAARFAAEVRAAGWTVTEKVGGNGVVAILKNGDGPVVLARIDMDGLPVKEETGLPYASASEAMHACGHDSHLAIGVGMARALGRLKDRWAGTAILVGQPAEELGMGARQMTRDPRLKDLIPEAPVACLSVHDFPSLAGTVGVCPGYASANVDSIDITLHGKGGHGAWPHKTVDSVVIGAELVLALQTIVSRKIPPGTKAVVTVGSFHAGTKHNIIGPEAKLQLTVRSYDDETRQKLLEEIRHLALKISEAHHAAPPDVTAAQEYTPAGFHDPALTARMKGVFERLLGKDNVYDAEPMMGGEDFSILPKYWGVPGLQFRVGGAKPNHDPGIALHSEFWAVDPEPTIRTGAAALARGMLDLLAKR